VVLAQVQQQLKVDAVAILLLNPYLQYLEYTAGRGFRSEMIQKVRVRLGEGAAGTAAFDRRTIHIRDLPTKDENPIRAAMFSTEGFNAYCVTPLIAKGRVHGVWKFYCTRLT
jgi:signal transduction protein with GAF and PtsI domain